MNTNGNLNSNNASNTWLCLRPAPVETACLRMEGEARERRPALKTRYYV
nr:MAG TPA: hypothetical protein [Siphoviridae sp. ctIkM22]